MIGFKAF